MRVNQTFFTLLFAAAVLAVNASRATAVEYKVTLLPYDARNVSVNGTDGINFGGHSFGDPNLGDPRRAIILDGMLENPVNLNPEGFLASSVEDVAGRYQVGWANKPGPGIFPISHAMLWNRTAESAIDLHPKRFEGTAAVGVSGEYQVGSGWMNNGAINHALLWNGTAESAVELTPEGYWFSEGKGISGDSQVGYAVPDTPTGTPHAMLWRGSAESYVDLHPAEFRNSDALSISGDVQVGFGFGPSGHRALMWRSTTESVVDLHPPGFDDFSSFARDVAGNVQVGFVETLPSDPEPEVYAFAWHGTAESAVNLHSYLEELRPEFTSSAAMSVIDNGTILGQTAGHIVVWTPIAVGDFDMSGEFDLGDILLLSEQIQSDEPDLDYDLDDDARVTSTDLNVWIKELRETWLGDANLDSEFGTSDLVTVFQAGKFETSNLPADWSEGDWNADGVFNTSDLVAAFQDGGFERGPRVAVSAVPEPRSFAVLAAGLLIAVGSRRRRKLS